MTEELDERLRVFHARRPVKRDLKRLLTLFEADRSLHPDYYGNALPPKWTRALLIKALAKIPLQAVVEHDTRGVVGWIGCDWGANSLHIDWLVIGNAPSILEQLQPFRALILVVLRFARRHGKKRVVFTGPPTAGYLQIPWVARWAKPEGRNTETGKVASYRFDIPVDEFLERFKLEFDREVVPGHPDWEV